MSALPTWVNNAVDWWLCKDNLDKNERRRRSGECSRKMRDDPSSGGGINSMMTMMKATHMIKYFAKYVFYFAPTIWSAARLSV